MKNFIFALCGFLMLSSAYVSVQASSISEYIPSKPDVSVVDVGLPMIHNDVVESVPVDCMTLVVLQSANAPIFSNIQMLESKPVVVPKCPFRYVYKSKYNTHYSHTVCSKLITPY